MARQEQMLDHVEDEQRLHAVKGDAIPQFGPGEKHQPARMTEHESKPGVRKSFRGDRCHAASCPVRRGDCFRGRNAPPALHRATFDDGIRSAPKKSPPAPAIIYLTSLSPIPRLRVTGDYDHDLRSHEPDLYRRSGCGSPYGSRPLAELARLSA